MVRIVQPVECHLDMRLFVARQRDTGLREGARREDTQGALSHSWEQGWRTGDDGVLERGGESASPVPPTAETARSCTVLEAGHGILGPETHLRRLAIAAADLPSGRLVVRRGCRACICIPSIQGGPWRGRPAM